jgi:NADP-dependent 3-hydroxy acid dehydrogenase YdfG
VQKLIDETVSECGRLDYMFNNAGIAIMGEVRHMNLEHWHRLIGVNLWGVINGTTAAYQVMVRQGFGHIVNTASGAGLVPFPNLSFSCPSYVVAPPSPLDLFGSFISHNGRTFPGATLRALSKKRLHLHRMRS